MLDVRGVTNKPIPNPPTPKSRGQRRQAGTLIPNSKYTNNQ
jgi:hypothetical protein